MNSETQLIARVLNSFICWTKRSVSHSIVDRGLFKSAKVGQTCTVAIDSRATVARIIGQKEALQFVRQAKRAPLNWNVTADILDVIDDDIASNSGRIIFGLVAAGHVL